MKAIIFGATGMVGMGVLLECLDDERVESVLLVSRHPIDVSHPKVHYANATPASAAISNDRTRAPWS